MRAFRKDFIREITKNKGRFLSVFFIVLLGAAFFSGIRSAEGDMKVSADRYYDEVNYMDLKVLGTLGLTDDDLADIAKTDGVKAVYGGKTVEVLHDIGESEQVVKLIALTDGVNEPRVVEGRMPEKEDEILVDTQFLKSSGCEIGDQVTFTSGTEDPLSDSLTGDTFTIVGSATLPYYMDLNRGTGSIGNGSINSFALLLPETFTSDLYTEIYVQADGAQEEASYSDAYDETVKAVQTKIEALKDAACDRRYTAVKTEGQEKIDDAKQQVADAEQKLADAKTELDDGAQQLADAKVTIADKEQELLDGEQTLKDKEQELLDGKQTIADGETQLADAKQEIADGKISLADAKQEIADKEKELEDGKAEYEKAKADAEPEIADAKQEIADGEKTLADLKKPTWYVWGRDKVTSTESFGQDAGRISNIGKFFPVIFFLVAALVSLTTMTRMIEEQRQQIGTLKALGYSDGVIAFKYFAYAMLSTVSGALAGVVVGEKILPWVIMNAYGMLYTGLPYYMTPLNWEQGGLAILASAACTGVATIAACYKELAAGPAELMRPEAPKNGKRIFLERIGVLWKHLNFTQKSTVRNLVRYKKRFFMTVIGIGGCMGLILVGFGLQDSITAIAKNQFVSLFTYQANAVLNSDVDESEKEALQTDLENYSGIDELLEMYCQNIELQTDKKTVDAVLEVPKELTNFNDFYAFRDRKSGEVYEFPTDGGAAISEKTATMLGVKAGDTVQLKKGDDIVDVKISIIVENYVRHYLYLAPDLYEELFGGAPDYNQLLMKYQDMSGNYETALGEKIMTYDGVAAISFTSDLIDQIDNMLRSLDIVIVVLIVSAGLLAFVVLYNLNNINITERQRELATLKVLGFFDGEVASYVYRENMVLTLFGVIAGMGIGTFLHHCVIQTVEVDMMMFGRNVFPRSYGWSALITLAFALFVNFMMFYRLRKIDMIESLKSVE